MMEQLARNVTMYVSHSVEMLAAVIIGLALIKMSITYIKTVHAGIQTKESLRLQFGSSVAVALELMLGADVLATAVSPGWNDIGKLAAIAVLRTALNYFLEKELRNLNRDAILFPNDIQNRA
jgi:uncharacterized membrane protein